MVQRILLSVVLVVLVLPAGGCRPAPEVRIAPLDPVPRVAIMSAFEPELDKFRAEADITDSYVINGRTYHAGRLAGNDVVMVLSGTSMVNAAMTTQTLLDHFDVSAIVFSGIAGGVNPNLGIGDVVVPAQWGQYQEQVFARETPHGWDLGWYSQEFEHFGMMFPQKVSVTSSNGSPDSEKKIFWFQVDPAMLEAARQAANAVRLSRCTGVGICLAGDPELVIGGNGVSGPTFVDNAEYRDWVWETFDADALDMETAAVAHVAYVNGVPFIAFRSLSDLAGGGPGKNEVVIFYSLAADNSAAVVMAFLGAWAGQ